MDPTHQLRFAETFCHCWYSEYTWSILLQNDSYHARDDLSLTSLRMSEPSFKLIFLAKLIGEVHRDDVGKASLFLTSTHADTCLIPMYFFNDFSAPGLSATHYPPQRSSVAGKAITSSAADAQERGVSCKHWLHSPAEKKGRLPFHGQNSCYGSACLPAGEPQVCFLL